MGVLTAWRWRADDDGMNTAIVVFYHRPEETVLWYVFSDLTTAQHDVMANANGLEIGGEGYTEEQQGYVDAMWSLLLSGDPAIEPHNGPLKITDSQTTFVFLFGTAIPL